MPADFRELSGNDAYEVLGVDPAASRGEIRRAYRGLAKTCHPDLFSDPEEKAAAEERIRLVNAAYGVLEHRRAAYDDFRDSAVGEESEVIDDPWDEAVPETGDPWDQAEQGTGDPWDAGPEPADAWAGADPWTDADLWADAEPGARRQMPQPALYRQVPYAESMRWSDQEHRQGLLAAGELFRYMVTGGALETLPTPTIGLGPGEDAYLDLSLEYSRYYSVDVPYQVRRVIPIGSPSYIIGTLAGNALGNAISRRVARTQAAACWREQQIGSVVLTNRRLSIGTRSGRLTFWHRGLAEFLPDPDAFTLTLVFYDTEPMRLRGPATPWLSVAMACLLYPPLELLRIPGFAGMTAWLRAFG